MALSTLDWFLLGFNIAQFIFWSLQIHTLTNKLMSKNFAEYKAVKRKPEKVKKEEPTMEELAEEAKILNELNGMFKT